MNEITCQEASKLTGMSVRRIQQMCKTGEISGAKKIGKSWMIPFDFVSSHTLAIDGSERKPLPIGVSDYKEAVKSYYYVDKTNLIKDFLDSMPKVSLFTRPRRFGKTLTMDMLRVFFEKTDKDTSVYFKDKAIWDKGKQYTDYQGKYPVVFLSFKDVKCSSWEETSHKLQKLISLEFLRHDELKNSAKLNSYEVAQFDKFASENASAMDCEMALQILTALLCKHHGKECVVIIDEYDTPIETGYQKGFYEEVICFMRNLFSGGLKDNSCLAFGFLTGILRVAKESVFSDLNNIKIYSILDTAYSQYFGFTKEEVQELLSYYGKEDKFEEICKWYDGYRFGNSEIFNPWSVINCVSTECAPQAYWVSTGSNDIIGQIIADANEDTKERLHCLMKGESVVCYVDPNIVYDDIRHDPNNVFSFLLLAGYLKAEKVHPQEMGGYICELKIPNQEIAYVYGKEILEKTGKQSLAVSFRQAIFQGDVRKIRECLEKLLLESISVFDGANESFYHGMMLGLCAVVGNKYLVSSNREAGLGRFDIELCPVHKGDPAFLFELKYVKDLSELEDMAEKALEQINEKRYDSELKKKGLENILKIGIAFCGKHAAIKSSQD